MLPGLVNVYFSWLIFDNLVEECVPIVGQMPGHFLTNLFATVLVETFVETFVETLVETLVETFVKTLFETFVETLVETLVKTLVVTSVVIFESVHGEHTSDRACTTVMPAL